MSEPAVEGYLYVVYGPLKYLQHAFASAVTLRRHDASRPIALACEPHHEAYIKENGITIFDRIVALQPENASIVGFKHNFHKYLVFDKTLYLDSDIVWCRNPDPLWKCFSMQGLSITGNIVSDPFFGSTKGPAILIDLLLRKRAKTLKRFGISYLSRVQSGLMYGQDRDLVEKVCITASEMLRRKEETHFKSRLKESGRSEESCEWSLAMAMSKLGVSVVPWIQGQLSPQVDYIDWLTVHDEDFKEVSYRLYTHDMVYQLRGLSSPFWRKLLMNLFTRLPGRGDYIDFVPFCLHFGWLHQKGPFERFSERMFSNMQGARGKPARK